MLSYVHAYQADNTSYLFELQKVGFSAVYTIVHRNSMQTINF